MSKDTAAIRDQLGNDPDETFFLDADYDESVGVEGGPAIVQGNTYGNSWIVGSSTNGIVGVNTGTEGGGQQVVGASGRVLTTVRIVNPNNVFHEHFRDTDFKDTDEPNTADWNTTLFRIAMHTSDDHNQAYNTISTFKSIFLNVQTIIRATLNATETRWNPNDKIAYFLSSDGGSNWEEVTVGIEHVFINQGQDLRIKVVFFGNGGASTYIEDPQVSYVV